MDTPKLFTTFNAAKLLGVDMTTVIDWCKQGKLPAFKTPGGHRRIHAKDLVKFLQAYKMPVPATLQQMAQVQCLVVDDEPEIRRLVSRVIRNLDSTANVDTAEDGFEAGKKIVDMLPHLVVLDLMLPGINGFKVCENIRNDPRLKDTKILAITGLDTAENKKRIMGAGANDYLPKPFEADDLKKRLQALLGQVAVGA